jgi:hypothetical protein
MGGEFFLPLEAWLFPAVTKLTQRVLRNSALPSQYFLGTGQGQMGQFALVKGDSFELQ